MRGGSKDHQKAGHAWWVGVQAYLPFGRLNFAGINVCNMNQHGDSIFERFNFMMQVLDEDLWV